MKRVYVIDDGLIPGGILESTWAFFVDGGDIIEQASSVFDLSWSLVIDFTSDTKETMAGETLDCAIDLVWRWYRGECSKVGYSIDTLAESSITTGSPCFR